MLLETIIFFLGLSIVFYVLFGGADFGAGVLELLSGEEDRETIAHAIGPVWEANHVWLILVVVILFMAFPKAYAAMSMYLHIPLLIMLLGIVLRGTAFTYMNYDAIQDQTDEWYNWVFKVSSVVAPLFLGITAGAAMLGDVPPDPANFWEAFIVPWFNFFSFSVGLFTVNLFTFLAAVYLIGETDELEKRQAFTKVARWLDISAVIVGGLVFLTAEIEGWPLLEMFLDSWFALSMVILATLLFVAIRWSLDQSRIVLSRIFAALQVMTILLAWFWVQFPVLFNQPGGQAITFYNAAAPDATLVQLVWALVVGSCIILPFLFYLMKTFKGSQFKGSAENKSG